MEPVTWDPSQYGRFSDHRLRPALELLARVSHADPRVVHDLGCGRGELARLMADRWPAADVTGSDLSAEMLTDAAKLPSRVHWIQADLRCWEPDRPQDVIYSNAVLHWVDDHDQLLPRLVGLLAPGGVLAAQMPLSWHEPSHRIVREVLEQIGTEAAATLHDRLRRPPVASPEHYFETLRPLVTTIDIWTTTYLHELAGPDGVFEWVKGSALRPVLTTLLPPDRDRFVAAYRSRLRDAYATSAAGTTVYRFPRLFIVATR
jgi:trans-aconitate 2-methyltransferase